jgi:ABC-type dipeptide/oligopeptide/nickel transport system permease component
MKHYIVRRLGYSLLSLFLLSLTIFFFVRVTGDPAALLVEPGASAEDIAAIHHQFGLDRPLIVQYGLFMASLLRGDFGQSFYYQTPVFELYLSRLPNSLELAFVAMLLSLVIGIPSGILASVHVGRFWDSFGKIFSLLGLSLPSFWVGLVLILVFSVYLGWLPSSGSGTPLHLIMPAFAPDPILDAGSAGLGIRQARTAQGPAAKARYCQARLQERADPGVDPGRDQPRDHGQCRGGRRSRVRLAGYRPPAL